MNLSDIFSGAMSPAKWRALGEYLQSSGVSTGPGMRVRKVGNRTIISAKKRHGRGSGNTLPPFTLGRDAAGATIKFGTLLSSASVLGFELNALSIESVAYYLPCFAYANPIPGVTVTIPDGMEPGVTTSLGAWGNVYLYWECDELGVITLCEIRGPDEPDSFPIPFVGPDLIRGFSGPAKYWVLIGTVPEPSDDPEVPTEPITQLISSDVTWAVTIPQTFSSF